jgi:hypothetical protein
MAEIIILTERREGAAAASHRSRLKRGAAKRE